MNKWHWTPLCRDGGVQYVIVWQGKECVADCVTLARAGEICRTMNRQKEITRDHQRLARNARQRRRYRKSVASNVDNP